MARVTVEDCIVRVPNRFDLVMLASQRAREIAAGGKLTVDRDNDKNPVVALREIADETIDTEEIEESIVQGMQKYVESDDLDEDELDDGASLIAEDGGVAIAELEDTVSVEELERADEEADDENEIEEDAEADD